MQLCPACEKAWICALSAAVSQSPSAWTISGALEPSSRLTFLWGTRLRMPQPTSAEPVKVSARVSSCSTIALPTSEPGPGMTLSQPSGRPGLEQDRGQLQRRDRRLPGGLEHDRVAGGDRRAELVGDQVEREVEGADRADDAVGHAQHHAELAGAGRRGLHRHRAAGQLARLDRGEGQGVDAALGLDRGGLQRLAGLGGDRQRQVLDPLADQLRRRGRAPRRARAGGSRPTRRPPARRSAARSTSAASPCGDPADDGAVVGALDLAPLAGLDPLAGGEELVIDRLHRLRRHAGLLSVQLWSPD